MSDSNMVTMRVELPSSYASQLPRLAEVYTGGDTGDLMVSAIELIIYLNRRHPEYLHGIFEDLLEYGPDGYADFRANVLEGDASQQEARRGPTAPSDESK